MNRRALTSQSLGSMALTAMFVACAPAAPRLVDPEPPAPTSKAPSVVASAPDTPAPAPVVATSAPVMCTQMACLDGVEIDLAPQVLRPGHYEITVAAGEKIGTCKIEFPYPPCGTMATQCEGTLPLMAIESGCDRPRRYQTLPKLRVGEAPERLRITPKRNGIPADGTVDVDVAPQYTESRPNGPACPPVCKAGTVKGVWREKDDPR